MDPISFVFAAYMDAVQSSAHTQLTDIHSAGVKVAVSYQPTIARISGVEG